MDTFINLKFLPFSDPRSISISIYHLSIYLDIDIENKTIEDHLIEERRKVTGPPEDLEVHIDTEICYLLRSRELY